MGWFIVANLSDKTIQELEKIAENGDSRDKAIANALIEVFGNSDKPEDEGLDW